MGIWNIYFIGKLALHYTGSIALQPWMNLCLAIALLVPSRLPVWRYVRPPAAVLAAAALLYHESFLPPWRSLLGEAGALSGFSLQYLAELITRIVDLQLILWLLALVATYLLLKRWLRISAFVLVALLAVPLLPAPRAGGTATAAGSPAPTGATPRVVFNTGERLAAKTSDADLDGAVERFYSAEARRMLVFPRVTRDIDLIFIHVCSLAWDDLRAIGQEHHPLLGRFDILYTRFNSAASYSGPAAIRLLRGTCGQARHDALYDSAAPECRLMDQLQQAGFQPQLLMNHNGRYGRFREDLERRGGLEVAPQPTAGARIAMQAFDGAPIAEDYDVLQRWWQRHVAAQESRVALYYNTISLHDGNRQPDTAGGWRRGYPQRARKLLDDIDHFISDLEASGARAVVVFIPEHGAAFHAGPGQIAGLRQVPNPNVTQVPVGVQLVGLPVRAAQRPVRVETSASYLGLNQLLAGVMAAAESDPGSIDLDQLVARQHVTPLVSENEGLVVVRAGDGYYTRAPNGHWSP
jgi:cellulose synthase operon protein YhjU